MKDADGFEPGAVIGPLIDMKAVEKIEADIADALKKGAKIFTARSAPPWGHLCRANGADRCDDAKFPVRQPRRITNLDTTGCPVWILCGVERGSREPQKS
jgi:hypothetical protein